MEAQSVEDQVRDSRRALAQGARLVLQQPQHALRHRLQGGARLLRRAPRSPASGGAGERRWGRRRDRRGDSSLRLDAIDLRILATLQARGRITKVALAEAVSL